MISGCPKIWDHYGSIICDESDEDNDENGNEDDGC